MIRIEKYKNTRHWAVWKDKELVAVVCYKKGAQAIRNLLMQTRPANMPATKVVPSNRND